MEFSIYFNTSGDVFAPLPIVSVSNTFNNSDSIELEDFVTSRNLCIGLNCELNARETSACNHAMQIEVKTSMAERRRIQLSNLQEIVSDDCVINRLIKM